jgi:beta-lactamase regulating signal transducer with metallopeptidase domain
MTGLNSWLSAEVLHALGWALIHSLWQGAGAAALAALIMAFIRRPAIRYLIGVGALAVMLAAPVATFLVLAKPPAPVPAVRPGPVPVASPSLPATYPIAALASAGRAIGAIAEAPRRLAVADILPWLVSAWACGVVFFSLRFAGGFLLLEHRRRTRSHAPGARLLALCQELQRQLGLDRAIQYLECGWVQAPAVIGWLRPAVLLPVFALTGLSEEQIRAVIAHELAHIRRHDWLVNLFQVLVESLLFYHPAMWWLNRRIRIERELACDEIAVSLTGSRLEYARALAQMADWKNVSLLAMAANRGPLTQRILYILDRKSSGTGQRVAGLTGGVLFLTAALAAANLLFGIAYPVQMAEAKESVKTVLVSSRAAAERLARQVVPTAKDTALPTAAFDQMDAAAGSKTDTLAALPSDLSRLLPNQSLATPTVTASNGPPAAPVQPSPPAVALDDQPVGPPTTRDPFVESAQAALTTPPATAPRLDPNEPYKITACRVPQGSVTGRVTSPTTIQMPKFECYKPGGSTLQGDPGPPGPWDKPAFSFNSGPCKNPVRESPSLPWGRYCPNTPNTPWLPMTVQLANPADASKMPLGKLVTLKGDFLVITQNKVSYLLVQNARVLYVDPFDRHAEADQPAPDANSEPAAFTPHTVQAPAISALNALAVESAKSASSETIIACQNSSVFGAVLSPKAILLQGFTCFKDHGSAASSVGAQDIALGNCPLASTTDAHKPGCDWDVALNVQLADAADADKMKKGRLVRLAGNFVLTRRQGGDYLTVQNAKIQFLDYFWSSRPDFAAKAPPTGPNLAPFFTPQPPTISAGGSASGIPYGHIAGIGY